MKVYVIVGHWSGFEGVENISARAVYSTRAEAEAHIADPARMWFDDRAAVIELEVDAEAKEKPNVLSA